MIDNTIAIIGCGNLGTSILEGILSIEGIVPKNITATRKNTTLLKPFLERGVSIITDNKKAVKK